MASGSAKSSPRELLPSPQIRAAVPDGDGDFELFDLAAPSFPQFVRDLTGLLSEKLRAGGVDPPEVALREVAENFIHAVPCTGSVVIDPSYANVYISDTGPGIPSVELALKPGYSTATALHRSYIRGVGLGLHLAREDLRSMGGELYLDSCEGEGIYLRLALSDGAPPPVVASESPSFPLGERQNNILFLLSEGQSLGPSQVAAELGIGVSTAHRELVKLQEAGLVSLVKNGKRALSDVGRSYLRSLLSL